MSYEEETKPIEKDNNNESLIKQTINLKNVFFKY